MLKTNDVPPEEQNELFRLADEMYRRESEEARERKAATDAAHEMGVPPEYLERAAAELHARKLEQIEKNRKRNRNIAFLIVGVAVFAMFATMVTTTRTTRRSQPTVTRTTSAEPVTLPLTNATLRQSNADPSGAKVTATGNQVVLEVSRMAPNGRGQVFANAAVPVGRSLMGYRTLLVTYSGEGLGNVRVDLEAGDARWKSENLPVGASRTARIDLSGMRKQIRKRNSDGWGGTRWSPPDNAREVVFKVGDTVNPPNASGRVTIEKIAFE